MKILYTLYYHCCCLLFFPCSACCCCCFESLLRYLFIYIHLFIYLFILAKIFWRRMRARVTRHYSCIYVRWFFLGRNREMGSARLCFITGFHGGDFFFGRKKSIAGSVSESWRSYKTWREEIKMTRREISSF